MQKCWKKSTVVLIALLLAGCAAKKSTTIPQPQQPQEVESAKPPQAVRSHFPDVPEAQPEFPPFTLGTDYGKAAELTVSHFNTLFQEKEFADLLKGASSGDQLALAQVTLRVVQQRQPAVWINKRKDIRVAVEHLLDSQYDSSATLRHVEGITPPTELTLLNVPFWANSGDGANIRSAPTTDARVITILRLGATFDALGETPEHWLAVGRDGVLVGYISADLAGLVSYPLSTAETDLDALTGTLEKDDTREFHFKDEQVQQTTVKMSMGCQTLEFGISTPLAKKIKHMRVCQTASGAWQQR
ncbi:SH3 domain-containing protein [Pokkaliibacter plantistimulans]|nr:SH3 domain-containing protein [Pokkaliibacter plantistimulans]